MVDYYRHSEFPAYSKRLKMVCRLKHIKKLSAVPMERKTGRGKKERGQGGKGQVTVRLPSESQVRNSFKESLLLPTTN